MGSGRGRPSAGRKGSLNAALRHKRAISISAAPGGDFREGGGNFFIWCEPPENRGQNRGVQRGFAPAHDENRRKFLCRFHKKYLPSSENCAIILYTACAARPKAAGEFCILLPTQSIPLTGTETTAAGPPRAPAADAIHTPHGDGNLSVLAFPFLTIIDAIQTPHGDGNRWKPRASALGFGRNPYPSRGRKPFHAHSHAVDEQTQSIPLTGTETF